MVKPQLHVAYVTCFKAIPSLNINLFSDTLRKDLRDCTITSLYKF